jgi:branched-chain amino acid transport system permease protein
MTYVLHICVMSGIYASLAVSLSLVAGQSGLLSVCHAAFYGIGAYTTSLLMLHMELPWIFSLAAGVTLTGITSVIIGLSTVRHRDDSFVLLTFAFQVILFSVMQNWIEVTRGPRGLAGIPGVTIGPWALSNTADFALLSGLGATLTTIIVFRLTHSPFGRVLRAIREDEQFPMSLGKQVSAFKLKSFVIAACLAAIAGGIVAPYLTYIDPTSFTVMESVLIIAMMMIGGERTVLGPIVGAVFLVTLPEILRFVGMNPAMAANVRQVLYGVLLILTVFLRPAGVVGKSRVPE